MLFMLPDQSKFFGRLVIHYGKAGILGSTPSIGVLE